MKNAFPVAAVLLGISTSLLAQGSGLKISGEMDAGIQNYKSANGSSMNRLQSGAFGATRMIFSGNEDLGDGMQASFMLEMAPALDTGATSRFGFFNRTAWAANGVKCGWAVT